eukprot:m.307463 g.307463  ORF g.307463 m.307463 type:complete len:103 (-) comp19628_c3_seq6:443-751(-)
MRSTTLSVCGTRRRLVPAMASKMVGWLADGPSSWPVFLLRLLAAVRKPAVFPMLAQHEPSSTAMYYKHREHTAADPARAAWQTDAGNPVQRLLLSDSSVQPK